ncbi:cyclin-P4-1-like isoform X1 [Phalaenopsis equestris]|uniref:cyclin-P4-1-like isoform X1 n=1 Tax=Phalaenopsis equestris TaxID=78828 RepID=UPI0009E44549|nr:cyclin-P4-1-like isoform X1 [Phalaenopsis equestris]
MAIVERENKMPLVINILSALFERTAKRNDELAISQEQNRQPPRAAETFSSPIIPAFSIQRYLEYIFYWTDCSLSCYIIAYIYVDRFLYLNPSVILDSSNVHRFLITSILTSVKFMDGSNHDNVHFATVGGISVCEMNELEVNFLFGLRFNLNVTASTYCGYLSFLLGQVDTLDMEVPHMLRFVSLAEDGSGLREDFSDLETQMAWDTEH